MIVTFFFLIWEHLKNIFQQFRFKSVNQTLSKIYLTSFSNKTTFYKVAFSDEQES